MKNLIIFGLILGLMFMSCGCISFGNGADGTAKDTIARISYGGWIWKTWRVELTNDHPISDGNGGTIAQRYGVENKPELIQQLQNYSDNGLKVKLYYHSNIIVYDWEYSDPEVIYKIEAVK